jgi:hypothetical protein
MLTLPSVGHITNGMAPRLQQPFRPVDIWAGHQTVPSLTQDSMASTYLAGNQPLITNLQTASTLHKEDSMNWNRFITAFCPIFLLKNRVDRVMAEAHNIAPGHTSPYEHYSYALSLLSMNHFLAEKGTPPALAALRTLVPELADPASNATISNFQIEQYVNAAMRQIAGDNASLSERYGNSAQQAHRLKCLTPQLVMRYLITYMGIQGAQANEIEDVNKGAGGMNISADGSPPVLSLVGEGSTWATNLWPNAYTGQQLWFLLKRVELDKPVGLKASKDLPLQQDKWGPLQFVPYVSKGLSKDVENHEMLYLGYGGQIERAWAVRVGEASIEPTKVDEPSIPAAMRAACIQTRSNDKLTVHQAAFAMNELSNLRITVNPAYLRSLALMHA